jgi:hypothetical protein
VEEREVVTSVAAGAWSCPIPLRDHERIVTGHGGGGRLSQELIEHLFRPAFGGGVDDPSHDAVVLPMPTGGGRLAFSTDSYVVTPIIFPGGSIGDLAVNGTVNDIAMTGAVPLALSTAFVLEEGLELATLGRIAQDMGRAAAAAEVQLVTGDTKVVEARDRGGLTITTAGFGVVADGVELGPRRVRPGDQVLLSGPIGQHGMAIMSLREGLEFETELQDRLRPAGRSGPDDARRGTPTVGSGRCATPPAAGSPPCCASWPRPATPASSTWSATSPSRLTWPRRAASSGSIPPTWPTRASSSPWSRPRRRRPSWRPCAVTPTAGGRSGSARWSTTTTASSSRAPGSVPGASSTSPSGEQLPRIC